MSIDKSIFSDKIFLFENFLTQKEINIFYNIAVLASENMWDVDTKEEDSWYKNRVLKIKEMNLVYNTYKDYFYEVEQRYKKLFNEEVDPGNFDFIDNKAIYRAESEDDMPPHFDWAGNNMVRYGIVIYINDNYSGGEIYYPKLNITIKPKKGSMVIHPSTIQYMHGVKKVNYGTRYSMANFVIENNK